MRESRLANVLYIKVMHACTDITLTLQRLLLVVCQLNKQSQTLPRTSDLSRTVSCLLTSSYTSCWVGLVCRMSELNEYDLQREERIRRNKAMLAKLQVPLDCFVNCVELTCCSLTEL